MSSIWSFTTRDLRQLILESFEVVFLTVARVEDGESYDVKVLPIALDGLAIHHGHIFSLVSVGAAAESAQDDMAHASLDQSNKLSLDALSHQSSAVYALVNFLQPDGG